MPNLAHSGSQPVFGLRSAFAFSERCVFASAYDRVRRTCEKTAEQFTRGLPFRCRRSIHPLVAEAKKWGT